MKNTILFLLLFCLGVWGACSSEINVEEYKNVKRFSQAYPSVSAITAEALEDGKITLWEYDDIISEYDMCVKKDNDFTKEKIKKELIMP